MRILVQKDGSFKGITPSPKSFSRGGVWLTPEEMEPGNSAEQPGLTNEPSSRCAMSEKNIPASFQKPWERSRAGKMILNPMSSWNKGMKNPFSPAVLDGMKGNPLQHQGTLGAPFLWLLHFFLKLLALQMDKNPPFFAASQPWVLLSRALVVPFLPWTSCLAKRKNSHFCCFQTLGCSGLGCKSRALAVPFLPQFLVLQKLEIFSFYCFPALGCAGLGSRAVGGAIPSLNFLPCKRKKKI